VVEKDYFITPVLRSGGEEARERGGNFGGWTNRKKGRCLLGR